MKTKLFNSAFLFILCFTYCQAQKALTKAEIRAEKKATFDWIDSKLNKYRAKGPNGTVGTAFSELFYIEDQDLLMRSQWIDNRVRGSESFDLKQMTVLEETEGGVKIGCDGNCVVQTNGEGVTVRSSKYFFLGLKDKPSTIEPYQSETLGKRLIKAVRYLHDLSKYEYKTQKF